MFCNVSTTISNSRRYQSDGVISVIACLVWLQGPCLCCDGLYSDKFDCWSNPCYDNEGFMLTLVHANSWAEAYVNISLWVVNSMDAACIVRAHLGHNPLSTTKLQNFHTVTFASPGPYQKRHGSTCGLLSIPSLSATLPTPCQCLSNVGFTLVFIL